MIWDSYSASCEPGPELSKWRVLQRVDGRLDSFGGLDLIGQVVDPIEPDTAADLRKSLGSSVSEQHGSGQICCFSKNPSALGQESWTSQTSR